MQLHTTTLLLRMVPTHPNNAILLYVCTYVCMYEHTTVVVFYTRPDITICSAASAHLLSYAQAGRLESTRLGFQLSRDLSDLVVQQFLLQQPLLHLSHTGLQLCGAVMQQDNIN